MTQTSNHALSLLPLLQINNGGWNTLLFENQIQISVALCDCCHDVCIDAVVLGCDHMYDDIYLYCDACLKQLIADNDGKCPINSHSDPVIMSNKPTRRQVSRATVICPYSAEFKHAQNTKNENIAQNGDMSIFDTLGAVNDDQKEGPGHPAQHQNIAIYQEQVYGNQQLTMRISKKTKTLTCHWRGTLNELINKHLLECTEKHDPCFRLNAQIKELEQENVALTQQVTALQTELNDYKEKNVHFKKELDEINLFNKDIENKNNEYQQQIIRLQNKIKVYNGDFEKVPWLKRSVTINSEYYEYHDMMACIVEEAEQEIIEKKQLEQQQANSKKQRDFLGKFRSMSSVNNKKRKKSKTAKVKGIAATFSVPVPVTSYKST